LKDHSSTTITTTPIAIAKADESSNLNNRVIVPLQRRESIKGLLQTAAEFHTSSEEMLQRESELFVSKSTDMTTDQLLQVANDLTTKTSSLPSDLMTISNATQQADRQSSLNVSINLSSQDTKGDSQSTPTRPSQEVSVDTTTKRLPSNMTPSHTSESGPTNLRSPQVQNRENAKTPSSRKPKIRSDAALPLSVAEQVPRGAHLLTNASHLSTSRQNKNKNPRRRPKDLTSAPSQNTSSSLPSATEDVPSRTKDAPPKSKFRGRLKNLANQTVQRTDGHARLVKESTEAPLPRTRPELVPRRKNMTKPHTPTSRSSSEQQSRMPRAMRIREQEQKLKSPGRAPDRSRSFSPKRTIQDFNQRNNDPQGNSSVRLERKISLTRKFSLGNQRSRVAPSRARSFQGQGTRSNNYACIPSMDRGQQKIPNESFDKPSYHTRTKSLSSRRRRKQHQTTSKSEHPALRDNSSSKPMISDEYIDSTSICTDLSGPDNLESSVERVVIKSSKGQGRTKSSRRGRKKATMAEHTQLDRNSDVEESCPDNSNSSAHSSSQGSVEVSKRGRSKNRLNIVRIAGRGLSARKERKKARSQDKIRNKSKTRNWLRKGE